MPAAGFGEGMAPPGAATMTSPHARRVTLSDVAARAGVSRTTAGKVLLESGGAHVRVSPATRQRVRAAAQALDYRPNLAARQLRGARSHVLGVLLDTVNAPVMNDRLAALEREARARGYRLLIGQAHLTTIDQQHDRYAAAVMELLSAIWAGTVPQPATVTIRPRLVVREST